MHTEERTYHANGLLCRGYIAYEESSTVKRPGVLIAHAWMGQDDFAREKAKQLAQLGYVAMAIDLYGDGQEVNTVEAASALMQPLFIDRKLLRERIVAAYDSLKGHPQVDARQIGAIGFCFGGLAIVELQRSGVELSGLVAFHGLVGDTLGHQHAKLAAPAKTLHGAFLALHGYEDPMLPSSDVAAFQAELNRANVDWQWHTFGHTTHAFTNPQANMPERGLLYQPAASERSWQMMKNFFTEVFAKGKK